MEMADGIIINKADGNNVEKAELAQAQFRNALHLFPESPSGWTPQVLKCSAYTKNGIPEVWQMITEYVSFVQKNNYFDERRTQQSKYWMYETINETLKKSFYNHPKIKKELKNFENEVLNEKISSFVAAKDLLTMYFDDQSINNK